MGNWDIFISHASEDKNSVARPLAELLKQKGFQIWYDEFSLTLGDSLRRSIDKGLSESTFGVVILSPSFFSKEWPQRELDGLAAREIKGVKVILPVWHNIEHDDVLQFSPILADRLGVSTSKGLDFVAEAIINAMEKDNIIPEPMLVENTVAIGKFIEAGFKDMIENGWKEKEAYKQSLIYPINSTPVIPVIDIQKVIDMYTIRLEHWGGSEYPYDRSIPNVKMLRHTDGLALVDNSPWPSEDWSYYYWYFNRNFLFLHRSHFMEDHTQNIPNRTMELTWLYMDVVRPVKFAYLINSGYKVGKYKVILEWAGMDGRKLISLDNRRVGFHFRNYICSEKTIKIELEINSDSNLQDICYKAVAEILWLFGFDRFDESYIRTEIQTILDGKFLY